MSWVGDETFLHRSRRDEVPEEILDMLLTFHRLLAVQADVLGLQSCK